MSHCRTAAAILALRTALAAPATGQIIVNPSSDLILNDRDLVIRHGGRTNTRLDSDSGDWRAFDGGSTILHFQSAGRNLFLGGGPRAGDLVLMPRNATNGQLGQSSVHLDGSNGTARFGAGGTNGRVVLQSADGSQRILLDGVSGDIVLGQEGAHGDLFVRDASGTGRARIDGSNGRITASRVTLGSGASRVDLNGANGAIDAGRMTLTTGGTDAQGADAATLALLNADPSIGLIDTSGGNTLGWYIQAGQAGQLLIQKGSTSSVGATVFVLNQDGSVCLGAC